VRLIPNRESFIDYASETAEGPAIPNNHAKYGSLVVEPVLIFLSFSAVVCCTGPDPFDGGGKVLKESLKRYADFNRVAVQPAMKEINEKTDISLAQGDQAARAHGRW
jgi:Initiator Replication protein